MKLMTYLLVMLSTGILFAADYCEKHRNPELKEFNSIQKFIHTKIGAASSSSAVAAQADFILEKLYKAQSKIIINWLDERQLDYMKDREMVINLWRRYFFENFLIRRYPTGKTQVDGLIEDIFAKVSLTAFPKKAIAKYEKVLQEVRKGALRWLETKKMSQSSKLQLKNKIQGISLYFMKQLSGSKFGTMPFEFIKWGLAYDPMNNEINVGVDVLKYREDETLFAAMAHEVGHAFDPCRFGAFFEGDNPFKGVISCLRSSKSVSAKRRDDSKLSGLISSGVIDKELLKSLKENPTCNKVNYPPRGIQKDQILESFADWFAAEMVGMHSKYMTASLRSDLCVENDLMEGSSYVSNYDRLFKIYLVHPRISEKLKIKPQGMYCRL